MKIKVRWTMETEGVSEIEVPDDEVLAWANDTVTGDGKTYTEVTPQLAFDWLDSGDDDAWIEQIDLERDAKVFPWNPVELDRLARE